METYLYEVAMVVAITSVYGVSFFYRHGVNNESESVCSVQHQSIDLSHDVGVVDQQDRGFCVN